MVLRKENGKERNKTQGAERTSADAGLPSAGSDLKASHLRWPVRLCLASLAFGEASSASRAKKRYEDPFSVDRPRAKTRPPRRAIREKAGRDGRFAHERTEIQAGIMSESHKKRLSSRRACPEKPAPKCSCLGILFRVTDRDLRAIHRDSDKKRVRMTRYDAFRIT